MLIAYDADGNVVGTLDYVVRYADDHDRTPLGLVDFLQHEEDGGEHTDIWTVDSAVGSKAWPEWIAARAHDFRVEREGPPGRKRIAALVHKTSGHRRERGDIERAIAGRIEVAEGKPADIRDLVGGPNRHLMLDDDGRSVERAVSTRPTLPVASAVQRRDTPTEQEGDMPQNDEHP